MNGLARNTERRGRFAFGWKEAAESVRRCHEAGIHVVMITGDQPATALAVARQVELSCSDNQLLTGTQIDHLSDVQLTDRAGKVNVYARVTAAHAPRHMCH